MVFAEHHSNYCMVLGTLHIGLHGPIEEKKPLKIVVQCLTSNFDTMLFEIKSGQTFRTQVPISNSKKNCV